MVYYNVQGYTALLTLIILLMFYFDCLLLYIKCNIKNQ